MEKGKSEFVTPSIAKDLKELGYDGWCCALFRNNKLFSLMGFEKINSIKQSVIAAPTWQQVIDWFIEKHKLYIETPMYVIQEGMFDGCYAHKAIIKSDENYKEKIIYEKDTFSSIYSARLNAIEEAIEMVKRLN